MYKTILKTNFSGSGTFQNKSSTDTIEHNRKLPAFEYLKPNQPNIFADTAQRIEDKETVQRQFVNIVQRKTNNTGLPDNLKNKIERISGYSMDNVKVHYNSPKPAQLKALAYAQGEDIHIGPGQEKHLPHEAWHIVQQKQGRVQPTTKMHGIDINDSKVLEDEADVMGRKAVQMRKMNSVFQFDKPLNHTIYYGQAGERGDYMSSLPTQNQDSNHLTIDSLNRAIGLTIDNMYGSMCEKRETINNALSNEAGLSQDERDWQHWLSDRKKALMMKDMDGKQCRIDTGMEKKPFFHFTTKHKIKGIGKKAWREEPHKVNINTESFTGDTITWNRKMRKAHDSMVEGSPNENYDEIVEVIGEENIKRVGDYTLKWLNTVVTDKFWRFTSLMGMDFLMSKGKHISFIRTPNITTNPNSQTGRRSITNSEWLHAEEQGYIFSGGVTRVDPVNPISVQKIDDVSEDVSEDKKK